MNKKLTIVAAIFAVMLAVSLIPTVLADKGSGGGANLQLEAGAGLSGGPSGLGLPPPRDREDNDTDRGEGRGRGPNGNGLFASNFSGNRSELGERMRERNQERREEFKDQMERMKEQVKQRREEMKNEVEKFKEQIKNTKERMKELQDDYKERRDGWNDAKKNLTDACKNNNATQCREARSKFNDEGKRFIGNAAGQMLTQIADVKTRIQASAYLDNTTINSVVSQLDAKTAIITADKAAVDALQNSSDVNATKQAATKLRDDWQSAQVTLRLSRELLAHAQFQRFLDHLTTMSTRFTEARNNLSSQGKDVTQLDADIAAFNVKLNTAATAFASAKTSYVSAMATAKTDADASSLIKSTNDQLKAARDDVQSARDNLRAIIKDLKDLDVKVLNDVAAKVKADADANAETELENEGGAQ